MGGNRAIKEFRKACELKGSDIRKTGIVNWSNKKREEIIKELIEKFSRL